MVSIVPLAGLSGSESAVEWGVASRPIRGEAESGDLHVVAPFDGGILAAAIDGLGHGPEAAQAARCAADVLERDPALPIRQLMERCHIALRSTRGAVMTLASFDLRTDRMTWTAVGNVEGSLCKAAADTPRESVVPRSGVVGYQLPALREVTVPIAAGDVLILATDGVSPSFVLDPPAESPAGRHARHLLDTYGRDTDDALVLVVRYLGRAP